MGVIDASCQVASAISTSSVIVGVLISEASDCIIALSLSASIADSLFPAEGDLRSMASSASRSVTAGGMVLSKLTFPSAEGSTGGAEISFSSWTRMASSVSEGINASGFVALRSAKGAISLDEEATSATGAV